MKILLLSEGRTGSYSVMDWISESLKLNIVTELDNFDYINNDNFIFKRSLSNNNFNLDDVKYFNKIIILYREDTLSQSLSSIYTILNKKWRHSKDKKDGFYVLDEEFLNENHNQIWDTKYSYDELNKIYKNLDFGLKITYENIFVEKIGQKMLEDYIGFSSEINLFDETNKLHKVNQNVLINFLKKEIDIQHKKIKDLTKTKLI